MNDQAQVLDDRGSLDFRTSFLKTRLIVGLIGVALPIVLVVFDRVIFGATSFRDSLSAYYYSGMRDWFVGSLCAIGAGLFVYMATKKNVWDNWLSSIAGACAVLVALFPTVPVDGARSLGSVLHVVFAAGLFSLLGVLSWRFGIRDRNREDRTVGQRKFWAGLHKACAVVIWLAIIGLALAPSNSIGGYSTLLGEAVAVFAFGASWFFKGSELLTMTIADKRQGARGRAHSLRVPETAFPDALRTEAEG